jgi:hypothetical protein
MKTRIEEAATEYAYKNDGGSDPRYCGLEDGFIAGAEFMQGEVEKLKAQNDLMAKALRFYINYSDDSEVAYDALEKVGEV